MAYRLESKIHAPGEYKDSRSQEAKRKIKEVIHDYAALGTAELISGAMGIDLSICRATMLIDAFEAAPALTSISTSQTAGNCALINASA